MEFSALLGCTTLCTVCTVRIPFVCPCIFVLIMSSSFLQDSKEVFQGQRSNPSITPSLHHYPVRPSFTLQGRSVSEFRGSEQITNHNSHFTHTSHRPSADRMPINSCSPTKFRKWVTQMPNANANPSLAPRHHLASCNGINAPYLRPETSHPGGGPL